MNQGAGKLIIIVGIIIATVGLVVYFFGNKLGSLESYPRHQDRKRKFRVLFSNYNLYSALTGHYRNY